MITPARATTFGEISLVNQALEAPLILHGRIGQAHVAMEPISQRPHTYWQMQVIETLRGKPVGDSILLRSPGGELNGIGYHVAASASFRQGEEVIVMAQDTREGPNTKEIFGLLSGKYTVELNQDEKSLRSGFGTWVQWPEGKPLKVDEYKDLIYQIQNRPPTEREKNIRLVPTPHNHEGEMEEKLTEQNRPKESYPLQKNHSLSSEENSESLQTNSQASDTSTGGRSKAAWLALVGISLLLLAGFLYWRSRR